MVNPRGVTRRDNLEGRPMKSSSICTEQAIGFNIGAPRERASVSWTAILWMMWCFGIILKRFFSLRKHAAESEEYRRRNLKANSPKKPDSSGVKKTLLAYILLMHLLMATAPSPINCKRGSFLKFSFTYLSSMNFIITVVMAPLCHPAQGKWPVVGHWITSFVMREINPLRPCCLHQLLYRVDNEMNRSSTFPPGSMVE